MYTAWRRSAWRRRRGGVVQAVPVWHRAPKPLPALSWNKDTGASARVSSSADSRPASAPTSASAQPVDIIRHPFTRWRRGQTCWANGDRPLDARRRCGYTNKINGMLTKCFLMDVHGAVDLSGSLAAAAAATHHVVTGTRGPWRLGLPCRANVCQLNEAPADSWCDGGTVRAHEHSPGRVPVLFSQRLNKCVVSITFAGD